MEEIPPPHAGTLRGRVAVVTGATRGLGRAVAATLGEAGATVYVTGRSTGAHRTERLPGTVEETAEEVTRRGGAGVGVVVDHTDDAAVEALFARVGEAHGRLDLLVNNAWGGYEAYELGAFAAPLWEQPPSRWDAMFTRGVRAQLMAARAAGPLLVASGRALVVNTTAWLEGAYLMNTVYDVAKAAVNRLAFALAHELAPHGGTAVALAPGWMRTERVLAVHDATGDPLPPGRTESPWYAARAVAALAADPEVARWAGRVVYAGELSRVYGFTDEDGTQPPVFRMEPDAA